MLNNITYIVIDQSKRRSFNKGFKKKLKCRNDTINVDGQKMKNTGNI